MYIYIYAHAYMCILRTFFTLYILFICPTPQTLNP